MSKAVVKFSRMMNDTNGFQGGDQEDRVEA